MQKFTWPMEVSISAGNFRPQLTAGAGLEEVVSVSPGEEERLGPPAGSGRGSRRAVGGSDRPQAVALPAAHTSVQG